MERYFEDLGKCVVITREPGGTPLGAQFRELILDPTTEFKSNYTELFLFFADRVEHLETVVKPAISEGKIVLCDRFTDSTVAYQVGGRGIPDAEVETLLRFIDPFPDLTLLLDLTPEEGLKRAKKRAALDRFEQEEIAFHERVRNKFLDLAHKNSDRIKMIDASQSPDNIFEDIKSLVERVS